MGWQGHSAVVRAGAYADGAARGAPDAIQILDRWHLLRNGSDALRGLLDQHHRELRAAARTAAQPAAPAAVAEVPEPVSPAERPMRTTERRSQAAQERRDARFAEVARLREQGLSLTAIARTIGIERRTVRRWLRAGHAPTWRHADRGTSIFDPYIVWLEERWGAGATTLRHYGGNSGTGALPGSTLSCGIGRHSAGGRILLAISKGRPANRPWARARSRRHHAGRFAF